MKMRRSVAGFAACLLLAAAGSAWIAARPQEPVALAAPVARAGTLPAPSAALSPAARAAPDATPAPEGMTPDQWQSLRAQLQNHPQREAEIARVTAAVSYLSRLARYRALRTANTAEASAAARELAASLLDQLPARIANREVSGSEARRLQAALLDTLAATPAQREAARRQLADAIPVDTSLQARAALDLRYQREAAAVLADWQARPAAQRSTQQLEASLVGLRRSVFNPPASADATAGVPR